MIFLNYYKIYKIYFPHSKIINIKFDSTSKGFSLVELIVVLIITAILAQLGFTSFNRYVRRTKAFAAKTALKNIQRECESNRDLQIPETFTLLPIRGYSIATRDTNSCLGQLSDGKVAAIADNQEEIPNYFYDFLLGQISCSFNNSSNGLFKDCSEQTNIAIGNEKKKWNNKSCINSPRKSVPLYMSKGDQNFIKAYGVLQKWLSEPENIAKTDKLPNSQSRSNSYHSFSINNNNLVTNGFLDENHELKKELERSISSQTQTSEYKFDIWINPREKPSGLPWMREMEKNIDYSKKRPRLSIRRSGPDGYWRTAGHEIAKCN